jgi:hypothetical protein
MNTTTNTKTEKLFDCAGTSVKNKVTYFRTANGMAPRIKALQRDGQTDVLLVQLPEPMTKKAAAEHLLKNNDFRRIDRLIAIEDFLNSDKKVVEPKEPKVEPEVDPKVEEMITKINAKSKANAAIDKKLKTGVEPEVDPKIEEMVEKIEARTKANEAVSKNVKTKHTTKKLNAIDKKVNKHPISVVTIN